MRKVGIVLVAVALSGCQVTRDQAYVSPYARYVGLRMSDLIAEKGRLPDNAADLTPNRRTFFFTGQAVVTTIAPVYAVPGGSFANTCRVTVTTRKIDSTGTAADWQIESVAPQGPCGNF